MKRFLILLSLLFCHTVYADTINLHWLNEDGSTYQNSTCTVDGDLNIPSTPPTKYGYTFTGWKIANYIPIEYLESTGTQWIDTGIRFTSEKAKVEIKAALTGGANGMFGAQNGPENTSALLVYNNILFIGNQSPESGLFNNSINTVVMEVNNGVYSVTKANGTIATGTYSGSIQSTRNWLVCGMNSTNQDISFQGKIAYIKLWDNDFLVRDFIPILDKDGVPCMFDKVEGKFYYNQGTSQFIAGPTL